MQVDVGTGGGPRRNMSAIGAHRSAMYLYDALMPQETARLIPGRRRKPGGRQTKPLLRIR